MKPGPRHLGRAGKELARERLSAYMRYAELVAEQEAALEAGEVERFEELSRTVETVRVQIGAPRAPSEVQEVEEAHAAADALRDALAANKRIQARLAELRNENAGRIRNVSRRNPQARRYAEESSETPASHLDVKL